MALLEASLDDKKTWINLPTPSPDNYEPTYTHEEDSWLDSTGYLHREIVRKNRAKVLCGWDALDGDKTALLQSLYDYEYFYLKFTDKKNQRVIKKVYAGPLTGKAILLNPRTLQILWNSSVAMNFIEY